MTPDFIIQAEGQDITDIISDRLISLNLTDAAGIKSDTLEIVLDDRAPHIELPRTGAKLEIAIGYRETGLDRKGRFTVDEPVLSGPPAQLTIRARAADLLGGLKEKRVRSFDNITFGDLVATIAAAHGYTPRVGPPELAALIIPHLDQTNESDLNLLTRLANEGDAVAKPVDDMLLFVPRGQLKSYSGKDLPAVTLSRNDLSRWNVTLAERARYGSVVAVYWDLDAADDIKVVVGSGRPVYRLSNKQPNATAATAAAKAKFSVLQRGVGTISGACAGDVRLAAEGKLTLTGIRPGVDGEWLLTQVTHSITANGYSCEFQGETAK